MPKKWHQSTVFLIITAFVLWTIWYSVLHFHFGNNQQEKNPDDFRISMDIHRSSKLDELLKKFDKVLKKIEGINGKYDQLENRLSKRTEADSSKQFQYTKNFDGNFMEILKKLSSLNENVNNILERQEDQLVPQKIAIDLDIASWCDDKDPGGRQVLAYSLFGKKALDYSHFISNVAKEALSIDTYKNFTLRIYVGETFPVEKRKEFKDKHQNVRFCDVRKIPKYGDITKLIGTVWRFMPMADPNVDVFCSRDLDSPLLQRGGDAVKEWLKSDKLFHVMRDRSVHIVPILGGMWCSRPSKNITFARELLDAIVHEATKSQDISRDQSILYAHVWPKIMTVTMQHDSYLCRSYPGSLPFPTQRREHFVGCVRDCNVYKKETCPFACRPKTHREWIYC